MRKVRDGEHECQIQGDIIDLFCHADEETLCSMCKKLGPPITVSTKGCLTTQGEKVCLMLLLAEFIIISALQLT